MSHIAHLLCGWDFKDCGSEFPFIIPGWTLTDIIINLWPNCKPDFLLMLFILPCKTWNVVKTGIWLARPLPIQFSWVAQSCPTICDPTDCKTPGFPVYHRLPELAQTYVHRVSDAIQPSHSLLSPSPPAFNLSQHQGLYKWVSSIRWQNYWSFSFSSSPSNEYSGLISFRMDWFDLRAVRDSQESSPIPQFKSISSSALSFPYSPTLTSILDYWKNHSFD